MTDQVDTLDDLVDDFEAYLMTTGIDGTNKQDTKAKLSAREVALRIDELNRLIEEGETIVHQSDIFDRIAELEKLQGGHTREAEGGLDAHLS